MKKAIKRVISGSVLLAILSSLLITSPLMTVEAQKLEKPSLPYENITPKTDSDNWSTMNISEAFTNKYLNVLGLKPLNKTDERVDVEKGILSSQETISKSSTYIVDAVDGPKTVAVENHLSMSAGKTSGGYTYSAQISSGGSSSYVSESRTRAEKGNEILTTVEQSIRGAVNSSMTLVERKIVGDTVTKQNTASIHFANNSKSIDITFQGDSVWNKNESSLLYANATINQNFKDPAGQYNICFLPRDNATGLKALVTLPNGTVIDPYYENMADDVRLIADNGQDMYVAHLHGSYVWWYDYETVHIDTIMDILEIYAVLMSLEPVGIILDIITIITEVAIPAVYSATNGVMYSYYISIYEEHWWFDYDTWNWYLITTTPIDGEEGFRTNRYCMSYLGNWVFYPTWNLNFGSEHSSAWPDSGVQAPKSMVTVFSDTYGVGVVQNPSLILGQEDGNYAHIEAMTYAVENGGYLYGGITGGGVNFFGTLQIKYNTPVDNTLTHVRVYVGPSYYGPWGNPVVDVNLYHSDGPQWLNCGTYYGQYSCVAIAATTTGSTGASIDFDCVRIINPPPPF